MNKDISINLLSQSRSLGDVMNKLNNGIFGVVFLVDDTMRLSGLFTDGDVRRAVLDGATLQTPASEYMETEFVKGHVDQSHEEHVKLLSETIRHLPIIDEDGRVVDFLSWAEMWRTPAMAPALGGNELKYLSDCISTGWISSQGSYVREFEEAFATYLGLGRALTVTSGTTALHLALTALGVGPGDEVIVPDLTFGACANAVAHTGATPVFVDVCRSTWSLDPESVRAALSEKSRVILAVHLYGQPCDMSALRLIADEHGLRIVEDCAQALGARVRGDPVGTLGDISCFSFFANKTITTGEGGMVVTQDDPMYQRMQLLRDHGMRKERRYWHEEAGFNYRMTNMQAAIGVAQLERIETFVEHRTQLDSRYRERLGGISGIHLQGRAEWAEPVCWFFSVLFDPEVLSFSRDEVARRLSREGIETRPLFEPLHDQPAWSSRAVECTVSSDIAALGLSLPTGNHIEMEDVDRICDWIEQILQTGEAIERLASTATSG